MNFYGGIYIVRIDENKYVPMLTIKEKGNYIEGCQVKPYSEKDICNSGIGKLYNNELREKISIMYYRYHVVEKRDIVELKVQLEKKEVNRIRQEYYTFKNNKERKNSNVFKDITKKIGWKYDGTNKTFGISKTAPNKGYIKIYRG